TSILAGAFQDADYFSGTSHWNPTESNPKGYFEDRDVNYVNEDLLDAVAPWRPRGLIGRAWPSHRERTQWSQRWLVTLPRSTRIEATPEQSRRMASLTSTRPYLLKDPRFSYTLNAWRPHLDSSTVFVCMFRDPRRVAASIVKICHTEWYLHSLRMTEDRALHYWMSLYGYLLDLHFS